MPLLTSEQVRFFARNGFLVIPGTIDDDACRYLVEQSWTRLPPDWVRSDTSTWQGLVTDSCHTSGLAYRRGHLKFQKGALGKDEVALAAFGPDSRLGAVAAQLIGTTPNVRYRGLYMVVPFDDADQAARLAQPHVEAHPVQIVATTYLEDVEIGGGGLLVWPGSHQRLYGQFESKLEFVMPARYKSIVKAYRRQEPVEVTGRAGDTVIIHHRLLHAPSLNRGTRIRFAMFTDYQTLDFERLCKERPGDDPWEDWAGVENRGEPPEPEYRDRPVDPAALVGITTPSDHFSTRNKHDASRLIRSLQAGDRWVTLSDRPRPAGDNRIAPFGEDIVGRGIELLSDGAVIASVTGNDIIARLPPGVTGLAIRGPDIPLWLRVIHVALPLGSSEVVVEAGVRPGSVITLPGSTLDRPGVEALALASLA